MKITLSLHDYDLLKEKSCLTAFGGEQHMESLPHMPKSWIKKFNKLIINRWCYINNNSALLDIKYYSA